MDTLTAHTSQLTAEELRAVRDLLDDAFAGDFSDEDFEHALGGMHVVIGADGRLVAHGSVVQRRVVHGERVLRVGYVEAVAVRPGVRRQGLGGQVMDRLEQVVAGAYELGALSASEEGAGLYVGRGWAPWPGRIGALSPEGPVRLPEEEGSTYLWVPPAGIALDPAGRLDFDWREGDVL
ncbi:GNAT family N-acetyltransferase [Streptomyces sp. NPDC047014]|uniref:GNAT family N-acetyltransferase n=1 Tax=Streptomyces sp. NPDC047014 TaxID=3155736 RepID=UPI0033E0B727